MKVHLIKKQTIEEYSENNSRSRLPFADWLEKLKYADWKMPSDIRKTYNSADLLGKASNRAVFNIGGNNYRMICKYAFGERQVHLFVCWIGTHREYDEVCNGNEQFTINIY
jgi:mRNA interferase HigB